MDIRILSLLAALTLLPGGAALAQPASGAATAQTAAHSVAVDAVGQWLHDPQGHIIGSVRSLTDGGQTAVIMVGSYFQPGSHLSTVHASSLAMVNGKVTLQNESVQALNTAFWWP